MCGIVGAFIKGASQKGKAERNKAWGNKDVLGIAKAMLDMINYRGGDGTGFHSGNTGSGSYAFGHSLHSVVGQVRQPLVNKDNGSVFLSNCEIYNWKELGKKHGFSAKNDSEMLFNLIDKNGVNEKSLAELDGPYAFAFMKDSILYIARDIIGEKPVWYSHVGGFYFASEKKALEKAGCLNISELNPRKTLIYDLREDRLELSERQFFSVGKETRESLPAIERQIQKLFRTAVEKRVPERKFGLLFSGGIDSTLIAKALKDAGADFSCYTTIIDDKNLKEPEDLSFAKLAAKKLGLKLKIIRIRPWQVKNLLRKIVPLIEDSNVVKAEVALAFFSACAAAKKDGCKVMFSGLGSEEIFAGYQRHRNSADINKECVSGLLKLYERDLYRDDVVAMYNGLELRLPYLDIDLVKYALEVPGEYKIKKGVEKFILRKTAEKTGVPAGICKRKKRAAQYGSNAAKIVEKLSKKAGFRYKSEYMKTFYMRHNLRLGALVSTGKDSIFAMHIMLRQNYSVPCMITIKSRNPDSYMFHTPTIDIVGLQSEAMGVPVLVSRTEGRKEKELSDLKKAISEAKKKYGLDGIITGALYSNYQRDRIEKICDSLSLKVFSPLWHINQETELREMISSGFKFIMTKVACDGLDKSWLGRLITEKDVDRLAALNKKVGINVAGEGGEYETLVVDGPLFSKRIIIKECSVVEEDKNTASLDIRDAKLAGKEWGE